MWVVAPPKNWLDVVQQLKAMVLRAARWSRRYWEIHEEGELPKAREQNSIRAGLRQRKSLNSSCRKDVKGDGASIFAGFCCCSWYGGLVDRRQTKEYHRKDDDKVGRHRYTNSKYVGKCLGQLTRRWWARSCYRRWAGTAQQAVHGLGIIGPALGDITKEFFDPRSQITRRENIAGMQGATLLNGSCTYSR